MLSPAEAERLASFTSDKRRRDWLLGRWTAKRLLQRVLADQGHSFPLNAIVIQSEYSGAPLVTLSLATRHSQLATRHPTLSISHSHGRAFCATVPRPGWPLGADLERIVPRPGRFVGDFFTEEERALVARAPAGTHPTLVNAIWSAKEAVLKALRLGLRVDTRAVTCRVEPALPAPAAWTPFTITWHEERLEWDRPAPPLAGWWRVSDGFVLTLVCGEEGHSPLPRPFTGTAM